MAHPLPGCMVKVMARGDSKVTEPPEPSKIPQTELENIRRMYLDEKMSQLEIADHYGHSLNAVRTFMKRHNIPQRSLSETNRLAKRAKAANEARRIIPDTELENIRRMYQDEKMTVQEIGEQYGSYSAVQKFMQRLRKTKQGRRKYRYSDIANNVMRPKFRVHFGSP